MARTLDEAILESQFPMWGWSLDTLIEQLEAYHQRQHPDDKKLSEWVGSNNGEYRSLCGLKVDMLMALRVAGGCRN